MLLSKCRADICFVNLVNLDVMWGGNSGMMVQDPTKKGPRDVDAMFDRVRRFGAQEGRAEPPQPPSSSNRGGAFAGTSRTLNGEPRPEQPAPTASSGRPGARAPAEPVFHTITFWRNGFTVDDGPLRRLDDPANEPFLDVRDRFFLFVCDA